MAGMLQIITYLLCVYLVFKGFEILQIGLMSNRANRAAGQVVGILAVGAAVLSAFVFTHLIDAQAESMSKAMSR